MDLTPLLSGAERLLAVPYQNAALDTEILLKQLDGHLHGPVATAADKKRLKALRDRLFAHRACCQLSLFAEEGHGATITTADA